MGIFSAPFAYRRLLTELRGIRRALERTADVQELLAQHSPRSGGQSFRNFAKVGSESGPDQSGVTYTDVALLERALLVETELWALLGRAPTSDELERGLRGDVE